MIPNIFSLLGESIVGKHIAKGIIFSNSPKKFHPNGSRIQVNKLSFCIPAYIELLRSTNRIQIIFSAIFKFPDQYL